jgi:glycerol-3-phosphate cytidylyltransferase-like family protein
MLAEDARKLLFRVADVLDEVGLPFSLAYGTALGAVRNGGFIPHDEDIDLSCLAEDFAPLAPLIHFALREAGMAGEYIDHRHRSPCWFGGPYAIKFLGPGAHGDLAAWYRRGDERYQPGHDQPHSIIFPYQVIESLEPIEFYGRRFLVPTMHEPYLSGLYGPNWRTPARSGYPSPAIVPDGPLRRIYVPVCADPLHRVHVDIIRQAACYGEVVVGLMTDEAIATYKPHPPACCFADRLAVLSALDGVRLVVPQTTLDYRPNLQRLKPALVLHGDDWRDGPQQQARQQVIETLATWDGQLVEVPYTPGISSTQIKERLCDGPSG